MSNEPVPGREIVQAKRVQPVIEQLRIIRTARRIGQRPIAKVMGYDYNTLQKVENGQSNPSFAFVVAYANALGLEIGLCQNQSMLNSESFVKMLDLHGKLSLGLSDMIPAPSSDSNTDLSAT